ncbi:MAG: AAA family ATPase, partial [bacterium]
MDKLVQVEIEGYKSLKKVDLSLGDINVLIGSNGSGKTNFISLFKMLNFMVSEGLQLFVSRAGGANSLLHYGAKQTPQMRVVLHFQDEYHSERCYLIRLMDAAPDTLIFAEETVSYKAKNWLNPKTLLVEVGGHKESKLPARGKQYVKDITQKIVLKILRECRVFQFHDTSDTAYIRRQNEIYDNKYLRSNAGNLAAFLYMLKESKPDYYEQINSTIKLAAPHFGDFLLQP